MSKVANMLNMVKILEDGKIHTINELSIRLEVSERMIRQYKQELEQAGIYIQGKQGINGGYVLDDFKSSIDIGLTSDEIYYLKSIAKDNLEKEIVEKIFNAYVNNEKKKDSKKIKYFSVNSGITERTIHPAELFKYINDWYVAAFCELRNEIRLFKLSAISNYKILDEKYEKEINLKK